MVKVESVVSPKKLSGNGVAFAKVPTEKHNIIRLTEKSTPVLAFISLPFLIFFIFLQQHCLVPIIETPVADYSRICDLFNTYSPQQKPEPARPLIAIWWLQYVSNSKLVLIF